MNDLVITQPKPLATTASAECSAELWQRLTAHSVSYFDTINQLAESSWVVGELRKVSAALQRHAEPCGEKAVIAQLVPLVTLYGVSDKSEAEWTVFWRFYVEALSVIPLEGIRAGVAEYVSLADSEFFPKPGPLKALCDKHAAPILIAANRARRALEKAAA